MLDYLAKLHILKRAQLKVLLLDLVQKVQFGHGFMELHTHGDDVCARPDDAVIMRDGQPATIGDMAKYNVSGGLSLGEESPENDSPGGPDQSCH
jgi:hypothetical protein